MLSEYQNDLMSNIKRKKRENRRCDEYCNRKKNRKREVCVERD